jgi:hypothetical protein
MSNSRLAGTPSNHRTIYPIFPLSFLRCDRRISNPPSKEIILIHERNLIAATMVITSVMKFAARITGNRFIRIAFLARDPAVEDQIGIAPRLSLSSVALICIDSRRVSSVVSRLKSEFEPVNTIRPSTMLSFCTVRWQLEILNRLLHKPLRIITVGW